MKYKSDESKIGVERVPILSPLLSSRAIFVLKNKFDINVGSLTQRDVLILHILLKKDYIFYSLAYFPWVVEFINELANKFILNGMTALAVKDEMEHYIKTGELTQRDLEPENYSVAAMFVIVKVIQREKLKIERQEYALASRAHNLHDEENDYDKMDLNRKDEI